MAVVIPFPGSWLPNDPRAAFARVLRRIVPVQKESFLCEARLQALPLMAVAILVADEGASEKCKTDALAFWDSLDPEDRRNEITTLWICGDIEVAGIPVAVGGSDGGMWRLAVQGPSIVPGRLRPTESGLKFLQTESRCDDTCRAALTILGVRRNIAAPSQAPQ